MIDYFKYIISDKASVKEALIALNRLSSDVLTLFVINDDSIMLGTLTDGDIRRKLIEGFNLSDSVVGVMNPHFHYVKINDIDVFKIKQIKEKGIFLIPVLDKRKRIHEIYDLKRKKNILPIDVVLMAGGKGERLRPLTENVPKPLIKIGDKCIIDYNIDSLIGYGVNNIFVTVNYLKEQLEKHFENSRDNIYIKCVREPQFLGTMGSIKYIPKFENDTILVMNSDLFTNVDYEDFYLHFINNDADISVLSIPYSYNIPYGIFELEGKDIKGLKEKPTYNYYANGGVYLIKKSILGLIPQGIRFDATDLLTKAIDEGYKVIRFPLTGYWIDIGKHEDYNKAQELVKHL
jgi:dTDP-glucose pyrophosphorylase